MRRDYEMTESELGELREACRAVPYLVVGGVEPRSPSEKALDFWRALGEKLGFQFATAEPHPWKGARFFTAEPK